MDAQDNRFGVEDHGCSILLFAYVLVDHVWKIWNSITHGRTRLDLIGIFQFILKAYSSMFHNCPKPFFYPCLGWIPPPLCWVKINLDAALGNEFAAIAVVARDHAGTILSWKSKIIPRCAPLFAKASTTKLAIDFGYFFQLV